MVYDIKIIDTEICKFWINNLQLAIYGDSFDFEDYVILRANFGDIIYSKMYSIIYNLFTDEMYWDWTIDDINKTNDPVIAKSKYTNKAIVKLKDGYWIDSCYETQKDRDEISNLIRNNIDNIRDTIAAIQAEMLLN